MPGIDDRRRKAKLNLRLEDLCRPASVSPSPWPGLSRGMLPWAACSRDAGAEPGSPLASGLQIGCDDAPSVDASSGVGAKVVLPLVSEYWPVVFGTLVPTARGPGLLLRLATAWANWCSPGLLLVVGHQWAFSLSMRGRSAYCILIPLLIFGFWLV